jgi:Rrf2 family transcriptional regulator, iron-sulfur cluster assembly transcription factor
MRISALQEYGIRCILQIASHRSDVPLTVRDIARNEGLSAIYVAQILVTLRRAGFVQSLRGARGGYRLARPARDISVAQVLEALGPLDLVKNHCQRFPGNKTECVHIHNCGVRPVFSVLAQQIHDFLDGLNLEQLIQDEAAVTRQVSQAQKRWTGLGTPAV